MLNSDIVMRALKTAAGYHAGQMRKGKDIPYIVHPVEVAFILRENDMEEVVIAAGLMHDLLEDTEMIVKKIRKKFGERIVKLVRGASEKLENRDNISWEERKKHTIDHITNAEYEIQCITCAGEPLHLNQRFRWSFFPNVVNISTRSPLLYIY